MALSKVAEAIVLLPIGAVVLMSSGVPRGARYVPVVLVAAALALANYAALAAAYRRSELSLVYPVARGGVFLFLPLLGFLTFRERLDELGWVALLLIMAGIALLPLESLDSAAVRTVARHLRSKANLMALLAALATAGYTVWDKYAVGFLDTFLYFYGYTALLALWFGGVISRTPRDRVHATWKAHRISIVMIGVLNAGAYLLVLVALRDGMATQVLAVRQLSIPIGVVLGWRVLHEPLPLPRAFGAAIITGGCALAALM